MIVEVLADGDGIVMNESSDNLIVPKRTWKKFGLKRKGPDSSKTVDYGSRGNLAFAPAESVNVSRQSSRRSDVITPEPSVFPEEYLRRAKSSSSEEEDDESNNFCYESSKIYKIFRSVLKFFVGKVLRIGVILTTLTVPFIMVIVGSVYWSDCPREWRLPLFLVVGGATAVTSNLVNTGRYLYEKRKESRSSVDMNRSATSSVGESENEPRTGGHFTDHCRNKLPCQMMGFCTSLIHTFALGFFFAGCVWIYGAYDFSNQKYIADKNRFNLTLNSNYCNPGVYSFAFCILNLCFALICFSFLVALTHYVVTSAREKKSTA